MSPNRLTIMNEPSTLRHYLYNPLRQDPEDLKRLFVARRPLFDRLFAEITSQSPGSVPVHHLLIGQRGMGKTTMLTRLALELREKSASFLPLSFWEEQHIEVDRLSVFWLNCLDSYADALDQAGEKAAAQSLDARIDTIKSLKPEDECARAGREALAEIVQQEKRRLVLFIDNFNLLLSRLKEHDHVLRGFFTRHGAPIIIGAAIAPPADLGDYDAAFYDGFKTTTLDRLSLEETKDMILRLAEENGQPDAVKNLWQHLPRLSALRDLSGGNPRTSLLIYRLCAHGFGKDVYKDLESLLDETTPLFQSRFDQLSEQGQKLVARLARHWYAATAEKITEFTGFPRATVSPLLGRLEEDGIVEKTPFFDTGERTEGPARKPGLSKKTGYRLSERFFNIWLIMRSASRRDRAGIICLARFLEAIYTPEELAGHAQGLACKSTLGWGEAIAARALTEILGDETYITDLRRRSETTILEHAPRGSAELEGLLDPNGIDTKVYEHVELKERLKVAVPSTAKTTPGEFADLVLGSISKLVPDGRAQWVIKALGSGRTFAIDSLANTFREEAANFESLIGKEALEWLQLRMRQGLLSQIDEESVNGALRSAPNAMALQSIGELCQNQLPELAIQAYQRATKLDDTLFDSWNGLGSLQHQAGRIKEAEEAYQRALQLDDTSPALCANYGQILAVHYNKLQEAEKWLRRAAELDPRNAQVAHNLATCLWYLGGRPRVDECLEWFRKAADLDLSNPKPWISMGHVYHDLLQNYVEASKRYQRAISMVTKSPEVRTVLGTLLLHKLRKPDEAEQQFRKAIDDGAVSSGPWIGLGQIYGECRNDYPRAEREFRLAMQKEQPAGAWAAYGEMLMRNLHKLSEAEAAFREALRIDPDNGIAWHLLSWLQLYYYELPDAAKQSMINAVEKAPKISSSWNSLGNLEIDYYGDVESAQKHFLKAANLDPTLDVVRHNQAFLLRDHLGDIAAAKALFTSLNQPDQWQDTQALHQALFAAYDQNWGQAQEALRKGLAVIGEQGFPRNTQDDWFRASAVLLHLGYGRQLLDFLKAEGEDQRRMPWYEALNAHVLGDRQYLLNIPLEAQEVAGKIYDQIARRLKFLPENTRRR